MPAIPMQTTISPNDQSAVCTRPLTNEEQLDVVIADAIKAQKSWKKVSIDEKIQIAEKWMVEFERLKDVLAEEITVQMGRPVSQAPGEVSGALYRAKHLISIAKDSLKDIPQTATDTDVLKRFIRRDPIGVIAIFAPWNFPYLTVVNSLVPAILAGNSVIIKPSPQTPSAAERFMTTFEAVGLPRGVIQVIHADMQVTAKLAADARIGFLSFTGSVAGGRILAKAAADGEGFKGVGLELGGKDPAYVRSDIDVKWAAAELVDGSMFNSGQSCCAVERIYVHSSVYDQFIEEFASVAKGYKLGDARDKETNLGPVVSLASAERIRKQVKEAIDAGARNLIEETHFEKAQEGTTYVAPVVLVDVNHEMDVMMDETFGPVIGIQKVDTDEEALQLMNDSPYGLTASVWTNIDNQESADAFNMFSNELEAGTVFLNRCDCPDPALPWCGVKNSGRGVSLSTFGFDQLTRPKGINMKIKTT